MNELYSPVVLSKDEIELINIVRSMGDKESKSTIVELLRQIYKMDCHYRFRAIRENAIEYGKRYKCSDTPKAQFGDLRIFNTKNKLGGLS